MLMQKLAAIILAALLCLYTLPRAHSQSKYAGEFLELGAGARAAALGGAQAAAASTVTAGYYNPAG